MRTLWNSSKPSETNARALANFFPAIKRKKFDPLSHSANFNSQQKKKGFFKQRKIQINHTGLFGQ